VSKSHDHTAELALLYRQFSGFHDKNSKEGREATSYLMVSGSASWEPVLAASYYENGEFVSSLVRQFHRRLPKH
jgi:hypothetical protein